MVIIEVLTLQILFNLESNRKKMFDKMNSAGSYLDSCISTICAGLNSIVPIRLLAYRQTIGAQNKAENVNGVAKEEAISQVIIFD